EELALGTALLAGAHLDHFFSGNQHITETLLHFVTHNAIAQRLRNRLFKTRIGVDDVPTIHCYLLSAQRTTRSVSESRNRNRLATGSARSPPQPPPTSCG